MRRPPSEDDIRTIYRATVDELFDFVVRRAQGDVELAEDITQETWLRAVDDWDRNGVPERPAAWLTRVAARLLSNHRRHEAVERIDGDDPDSVPNEEDGDARREQRSLVQRALDALPAAQARLLETFHFGDGPSPKSRQAPGYRNARWKDAFDAPAKNFVACSQTNFRGVMIDDVVKHLPSDGRISPRSRAGSPSPSSDERS